MKIGFSLVIFFSNENPMNLLNPMLTSTMFLINSIFYHNVENWEARVDLIIKSRSSHAQIRQLNLAAIHSFWPHWRRLGHHTPEQVSNPEPY